jgi:hypothetical protein
MHLPSKSEALQRKEGRKGRREGGRKERKEV